MTPTKNNRETGATKYPVREGSDATAEFSQDAAENKKPKGGFGLSARPDHEMHRTEGQNSQRASRSPATQKVAGAGPAIANRSKDAQVRNSGSDRVVKA